MASKKFPFALVLSKKAATGSNDLEMDLIEDGQLYCVQGVTVENETSAYTDLRILIGGVGEEMALFEEDTPQAATLYWTTDEVYLREGQALVCRLSGCTSGDKIRATLRGWWQQGREVEL